MKEKIMIYSLYFYGLIWRDYMDDSQCCEFFGLPYGNLIGPLIAGIILIMIGLSAFIGWDIWNYLWVVIIIIIGLLIILGAIYSRKC